MANPLLGAKILVFALFCTAGTINPFVTLILQDLNYTAVETGSLISLSKLVSLTFTPILCALADTYHCHVPLLVCLSLVAFVLMLVWWGVIPPHRAGIEGVSAGHATQRRSATLSPGNRALEGDATAAVVDLAAVLTAMLLGFYYAISGSKTVITDTLVMKQIDLAVNSKPAEGGSAASAEDGAQDTVGLLEPPVSAAEEASAQERRDAAASAAYPMQRLWGSISYGCSASLVGFLIKLLSTAAARRAKARDATAAEMARLTKQPYMFVPLLHAVSLLVFTAVVLLVTRRTRAANALVPQQDGEAQTAAVEAAARNDSHLAAESPPPSTAPPVASRRQRQQVMGAPANTAANATERKAPPSAALGTAGGARTLWTWAYVTHVLRRAALSCRAVLAIPHSLHTTLRVYLYFMRNPSFVFPLFVGSFFLTLAEMTTWIFLFPYARRELHAPLQLFSSIMLVHLVSEVTAFTTGSFLLQQKRLFTVLFVSSVCYTVKLYLYSIVRNPWWLLPIEALHGPCAAFRLTGTVAHVTNCARRAERFFAAKHDQEVTKQRTPGGGVSEDFEGSKVSEVAYAVVVEGQAAMVDTVHAPQPATTTAPVAQETRSPVSMPPVVGNALASKKPEEKIELLATAYSIMWFASTGLPMAMTGFIPFAIHAIFKTVPAAHPATPSPHKTPSQPSSTSPAVAEEPMELKLFRTMATILVPVCLLFVLYQHLRMFR